FPIFVFPHLFHIKSPHTGYKDIVLFNLLNLNKVIDLIYLLYNF
ncbi:unnamed protein product, partial [marine sediment metagenome]